MPFQLSPGVLVVEKDFTLSVPAVSTSIGAIAGEFVWGPVLHPVTVSSEQVLVDSFGKPGTDSKNVATFFSAASFLSYSNNLVTVRIEAPAARNAVATPASPNVVVINNENAYDAVYSGPAQGTTLSAGAVGAKYPGAMGNSLRVIMLDSAAWAALDPVTDKEIKDLFDGAPGTSDYARRVIGGTSAINDELHVAIIDEGGKFSGVRGTVLEKYQYLSKASDAQKADGTNNFYGYVLNNQSKYVWFLDHPTGGTDWGSRADAAGGSFATLTAKFDVTLTGGDDGFSAMTANERSSAIREGYDRFANADEIDVSLIIAGRVGPADAKYICELAETRKDAVAFVSPVDISTGEPIIGTGSSAVEDILAFRTDAAFNVSSSYAVLDSGYKYAYDKYRDTYVWVPLCGDVAGLCARTDYTNDPWWSPGGFNRGQVKNVVKLGFNPGKTERDNLYKNGVNPVVTFPGQGTVLFGDKTLLAKPSAFDRINVRRLFIVLEKAIAIAAKYQLFEFNDAFTRAQFRNLVEPFLRDVKGRRGVYDFKVVCDETNNTGEVIDRNEFIADIYIKPARSINFITLNFIAVRTGVSFEEVGA